MAYKINRSEIKGNKICSKCGKDLPYTTEFFYKKKDKLRSSCKECFKKCVYVNRDTEAWTEKNRKYALTHHKKYRKEEREWISDYRKTEIGIKVKIEYNESHKVQTARNNHLYRLSARGKKILYAHGKKRYKLSKILDNSFTEEQWRECKNSFQNKCAYCGLEKPLAQEHFIPLIKGGEYALNNIVCACKSCNSSKGPRDFFVWYPKYKKFSKKRQNIILKYLGYKEGNQQMKIL